MVTWDPPLVPHFFFLTTGGSKKGTLTTGRGKKNHEGHQEREDGKELGYEQCTIGLTNQRRFFPICGIARCGRIPRNLRRTSNLRTSIEFCNFFGSVLTREKVDDHFANG